MEQSTLIKIAKLRTQAARHGKAFDVVRFVGDRDFAQATLQSILDTEDEALLLMGLELLAALKMVDGRPAKASAPIEKPTPAPAAAPAPAPAAENRYVGRLR